MAVTYIFSPNTKIKSAEVNANFAYLIGARGTTNTFTDSSSDDGTTQAFDSGSGWTDITNLSKAVTTTGGDVAVGFSIPASQSAGGTVLIRILDGSTTKWKQSFNLSTTRAIVSATALFTSISSGAHTFKVQAIMLAGGGTTVTFRTGQSSIFALEQKS